MRTMLLGCLAISLAAGCGAKKSDDATPTPTITPTPTSSPTPIPTAPPPPVGAPLTGITFFNGWTNAHALPDGVNTYGWEDSSNVSADGKTLYFSYTQYDQGVLASSGNLVITGPARPGQKGPAFDIYEARINGGAWDITDSSVNSSDPDLSEAASGVNVAETRMVFVNFSTSGNLYLSDKVGGVWQPGVAMPGNVNSGCVEDDPTLSPDGLTVWFDSDRTMTGCGGNKQIWVTHDLGGGVWSDPVNVTPGAQPFADQPFVTADGAKMYWTGIDNDCLMMGAKALCSYEAPKATGDTWGTPLMDILILNSSGTGIVSTVGETSVTADGHYMYFTYITHDSSGRVTLNLGVADHP